MEARFWLSSQTTFIHARLNGDLHFQGAQFKSEVYFDAVGVGGACYFRTDQRGNRALFEGRFSFVNASVKTNVEFLGAEFSGEALFDHAEIGESLMLGLDSCRNRATFAGNVRFLGANILGNLECIGTEFKAECDFDSVKIGRNALFRSTQDGVQTIFRGKVSFLNAHVFGNAEFDGALFLFDANFDSITIEGYAHFRSDSIGQRTTFTQSARFLNARINRSAEFQGAMFKSSAHFENMAVARSADFRTDKNGTRATFEGPVVFLNACIEGSAEFDGALFRDTADFDSFKTGGYLFFRPDRFGNAVAFEKGANFLNAQFRGPVQFQKARLCSAVFYGAHFFSQAWFMESTFETECNFDGALFDGAALFYGAEFNSEARFTKCRFERGVRFDLAKFHLAADFSGTISPLDAHFNKTIFDSSASFRACRFRVLYWGTPALLAEKKWWSLTSRSEIIETTSFKGALDLRGMVYEDVHSQLSDLFQRLSPFDRQPYSQLEAVMLRRGDERSASQSYLQRRRAERKHKFALRTAMPWLFDWAYKIIANYGKGAINLSVVSLAIIALGGAVFCQPGALARRLPSNGAASEAQAGQRVEPMQALGVSLRYFVPMEIPAAAEFQPATRTVALHLGTRKSQFAVNVRPDVYASFLRVCGVPLVGLAIAAMSGILRRIAR